MINCAKLIHPFQNDPGISQEARSVAALLSDAPRIDARKLADLLDYFQQLSRNVNFYHYDESQRKIIIRDWQLFFQGNIPFTLAGMIKYNRGSASKRLEKYNKLFDRRPSARNLQLILHFIYNSTISPVSSWSRELKDSGLPARNVLEKLIKDKLSPPVKQFICLSNTAVSEFKIKPIDFSKVSQNPDWQLQPGDFLKKDGCFTSKE